ncbi:peptidylprolyl isomerase [Methylocystis sp.]|jgi:peptidylprolyl isomerase|uniref:peptidylprolyl isomerase n=1 Tax=Methylocystis sp. TaxID=1911079 RepID=UPI003DA3935F
MKLTRRLLLAAAAVAALSAAPVRAADDHLLYLDTKDGRVTIKLRPDLAPKHVERIEKLAKEHFYDGIAFHRVIDGFMAQAGDPTGTGMSGSRYLDLKAEFSNTPFKRGVLGMARQPGDNDSANSQFFIVYADAPQLNGKYTVFGEVVSGMDVVDKIKKGSKSNNGMVDNPDKIIKMRVAGDES